MKDLNINKLFSLTFPRLISMALVLNVAFAGFAYGSETNAKNATPNKRVALSPKTDNLEEFRRELYQFYSELMRVNKGVQMRNQTDSDAAQPDDIQQKILSLSYDELTMLKSAFRNLDFKKETQQLRTVLAGEQLERVKELNGAGKQNKLTTANRVSTSNNVESPCDEPTVNADAVQALMHVALAAENAMQFIPEDGTTAIPYIVAAAAWTLTSQASQATQTAYAIEQESLSNCFEDHLVDKLAEIIEKGDSNRDQILSSVSTVGNTVTSISSTIVSTINSKSAEIVTNDNTNATNIINNTNTKAAQIITNNNQNKDTLINKIDDSTTRIINKLTEVRNDLRDLTLRTQIEANLAQNDSITVALYALPNAHGGHLDLVRAIVADTIAKIQAAGGSVGTAPSLLNQGDTRKAAGDFKGAFDLYKRAYKTTLGN